MTRSLICKFRVKSARKRTGLCTKPSATPTGSLSDDWTRNHRLLRSLLPFLAGAAYTVPLSTTSPPKSSDCTPTRAKVHTRYSWFTCARVPERLTNGRNSRSRELCHFPSRMLDTMPLGFARSTRPHMRPTANSTTGRTSSLSCLKTPRFRISCPWGLNWDLSRLPISRLRHFVNNGKVLDSKPA